MVFVLFRLLVSQRDGALGSLPEQESHLTIQQGAAELLAWLLDASARLLQLAAVGDDGPGRVDAERLPGRGRLRVAGDGMG